MSGTQDERSDIPKVLVNAKRGDAYERLRFFGKVNKNNFNSILPIYYYYYYYLYALMAISYR